MGLKELMELSQYSPERWGAAIDYDNWDRKEGTSQAFVHWTGSDVPDGVAAGNTNSEKAYLRGIEQFHLEGRGWEGLAYDWAIGNSGHLYRVRGLGRSAATSGDVDRDGFSNNSEGEAFLVMCGPNAEASEKALLTLEIALETLGYTELYGHKEASSTGTQCPGGQLMEFVKSYRSGDRTDAEKPVTDDSPVDKEIDLYDSLGVWQKGGKRNTTVKRIQALLNTSRITSVRVDGWFGNLTERAVIEYQERHRLSVDGIVGPKTWESLLTADW